MNHVTALFRDRLSSHAAIEQLVQAGFSRDDISVVMSTTTHGREFAIGATVGGVLGAIVAGLVAIGTITMPGSALLATGPLMATLAGGGAGTLLGAFVGAGLPEREAKLASDRLRGGEILVGVHAPAERTKLAQELLRLAGGDALRAA